MRDDEARWASRRDAGGGIARRWYRPLGSAASARLLIELVVERLRLETGPGSASTDAGLRADGGIEVAIEVEIERGVVHGVARSGDRRWSADLAPLATRLAGLPPDGWSVVVDREITRWRRAAAAAGQAAESVVHGEPHAPILIRLTRTSGPPGRTLRPAFGPIAWELVRDLGADGLAAVTPGWSDHGAAAGLGWDRIAARTVAVHEWRWASLLLDEGRGMVLGGPHVSALLYDPSRLRGRLQDLGRAEGLRVTVFTNSLLLVTGGGGTTAPAIERLVDSLRRFTTGDRRLFHPFTVEFDTSGASANIVTPM